MEAINPATGEPIREYPEHDNSEVRRRLQSTEQAFATWRKTSFADRSRLMQQAARILRDRNANYSRLMTEEMGKPIAEAEAEIEKCARNCDFFAEHAQTFLAEETVSIEAAWSFVRFDPLGIVLAIMPWNFPFWQVFRFAAPALMAGNVALLKHAANVPGCALAVEDVFHAAGFPRGVMTTVLTSSDRVAELIREPAIRAVTLTG